MTKHLVTFQRLKQTKFSFHWKGNFRSEVIWAKFRLQSKNWLSYNPLPSPPANTEVESLWLRVPRTGIKVTLHSHHSWSLLRSLSQWAQEKNAWLHVNFCQQTGWTCWLAKAKCPTGSTKNLIDTSCYLHQFWCHWKVGKEETTIETVLLLTPIHQVLFKLSTHKASTNSIVVIYLDFFFFGGGVLFRLQVPSVQFFMFKDVFLNEHQKYLPRPVNHFISFRSGSVFTIFIMYL